MIDRNIKFGLSLAIFGASFSLGCYFLIENIPLTAMGIGLIILGISWMLIPSNPLPKESIQSLIKSSCSNIEAFLEAIGAMEKSIYIPRNDGKVIAYIPIKKAGLSLKEIAENSSKLIFKHGRSLGAIIIPPASINPSAFNNPNNSKEFSSLLEDALIESEIAESIRAVIKDEFINIEIEGIHTDVEYQRFKLIMGSLPASISAQAAALALSKPIKIEWEKRNGNRSIVQLRVLEWTETAFT
ncbi:MAG: hypothetical protein NZ922_05780 [Candidatus Methanomethyliaceae archaeon]|nr:hypothetical protein [Candidatus Methanomethyliaceae archaeon]MDW7971365.1 hypothetical protein [Nitrososphaerota archaeon]